MDYHLVPEEQMEFIEIGARKDFEAENRWGLQVGDKTIVLIRTGNNYYAVDDVCTHDGGPLGEGKVEGTHVECPRHGARFDLKSGKAVRLPAVRGISSYPVVEKQGELYLGIPRTKDV